MLNDNFYRGSGITVAIRRLIDSPPFAPVEVYIVGCETIGGSRSTNEDTSMVPNGMYRCFGLMQDGLGAVTAICRFIEWTRRMRFDVIHAHHRRLAVLARLTGLPVLFTGHLTFPESAWFRYLIPRNVTGVSPSVVEYLKARTQAVNVHLVHNPVPFPNKDWEHLPPPDHLALSIGRLDPEKGFENLIDAWAKIRDRGVSGCLDIYGEGALRASLEARIARHSLQGVVSLRGFAANLQTLLPLYSFNILVSQKEGFPNAVVEAASHAIPTLLTDIPGSRDALPADLRLINGIPYGDENALTASLLQWVSSPQSVRSDGQKFRNALRTMCSPETVGTQFIEIYKSMLRRSDAQRS